MKTSDAKAKIICTIGPASERVETISRLIEKGMDVARLNFSHNSHENYKEIISNIRKASLKVGREVAILQDLQGPKIRIGKVKSDAVHLQDGDVLEITTKEIEVGTEKIVSTNHKTIVNEAKVGSLVLLDDGYIILEVEKIKDDGLVTRIIKGGVLKSNKGIVIPKSKSSAPSITEKDISDLKFGIENDIDLVALSFVRSEKDVIELRAMMKIFGRILPIIAKIERAESLENIDKIINEADGIMVARGDLGLEIEAEKVPIIQKEICRKCRYYGKPVIIATQMLESMINNPRPTRAEASDVANAVLDGADALMLSGETSVGSFPVEAVDYMNRIILEAEKEEFSDHINKTGYYYNADIYDAIANASTIIAEQLKAKGIIALTRSGFTAMALSKYRPKIPILALTEYLETYRKLSFVWGVEPYRIPQKEAAYDTNEIVNLVKSKKIGKSGDKFVLASLTRVEFPNSENSIKIIEIR
ncbi:MAG: pyruvate kinase [Ignavibacteria bacterium]|nr:pyruvate kinase [Ignavibacteria bacterium]